MRFVKESRIASSPEAVFAFHESKGAVERLTPPWEKVEVIERADSIRPGSRVVLRTWLGPFPVRWVAEHTEYEIDYEPPLGVLGRRLGGGFLDAKLQRLFDYRHETTRPIVEAGSFFGFSPPCDSFAKNQLPEMF